VQYQQAVAEARRLVKRSDEDQWQLAQLTYEQVQAGKSAVQWARDTGMSEVRAKALVRVWRRWGSAQVADGPSFTEAYDRVNNPSLYSENRTGTPWQEQVKQGTRGLPVEQKAEVARQLLADERVAFHARS